MSESLYGQRVMEATGMKDREHTYEFGELPRPGDWICFQNRDDRSPFCVVAFFWKAAVIVLSKIEFGRVKTETWPVASFVEFMPIRFCTTKRKWYWRFLPWRNRVIPFYNPVEVR